MATILLIILSIYFYFDFETNEETSAKRLKATTEVTFDNKTDNWTIAVVDTYEKMAGGHTYTLYGANGRYSTQQGTNGADPDFDWGTATVANGTDRVAYADSGDTWSWNKSVVRLIVENFRYDYYYTPTADLYINDVYIRTITSFDTNADFNAVGFDSNNPAHYQG